jgi:DNA processing protein
MLNGFTPAHRKLLTLCAMRIDGASLDWQLLARTCQSHDSLAVVLAGDFPEESAAARKSLPLLHKGLAQFDEFAAFVDEQVREAGEAGARLVTVLDEDYPANLRLVPNLPPFLFYRGELSAEDARSVAVVGTRQAGEDGLRKAARMSRQLVEHDVAVVSGLAKGIDTAAHRAALEVGGRTVAVMGTGIAAKIYPSENDWLADAILEGGGALVSQFWPTSGPARWTFPRRNVVTSGYTMGTVVIEASRTSGAKMQARIAAEHGKQVFLIKSLTTSEPWAQKMVAEGRAVEVAELDDILGRLGTAQHVQRASQQRIQLTLMGL